jgi:hypothetical protein
VNSEDYVYCTKRLCSKPVVREPTILKITEDESAPTTVAERSKA